MRVSVLRSFPLCIPNARSDQQTIDVHYLSGLQDEVHTLFCVRLGKTHCIGLGIGVHGIERIVDTLRALNKALCSRVKLN